MKQSIQEKGPRPRTAERVRTDLYHRLGARAPRQHHDSASQSPQDDAACHVQLPVPLPHQDRITRRKRRRRRQESRLLAATSDGPSVGSEGASKRGSRAPRQVPPRRCTRRACGVTRIRPRRARRGAPRGEVRGQARASCLRAGSAGREDHACVSSLPPWPRRIPVPYDLSYPVLVCSSRGVPVPRRERIWCGRFLGQEKQIPEVRALLLEEV